MTIPFDRVYNPDLVVSGIEAARWRMPELLGASWPSFERRLDDLIAKASGAGPEERRRLVEELMRAGFDSLAAELFRAIAALAVQSDAMKALRHFQQQERLAWLQGIARGTPAMQRPPLTRPQVELHGPGTGFTGPGAGPPPRKTARAKPPQAGSRPFRGVKKNGGGGGRMTKRKSAPARRIKMKKRGGGPRARKSAKPRSGRNPAPRAPRPTVPAKPRPRVVNLAFTNQAGRVIAAKKPLLAKQKYLLRVNIGPLTRQSVVRNAARNPVRTDLLPSAIDGHWLKLVAVSSRFKVAEIGRWVFLPISGPSWCCSCTPGTTHKCKPATRKPHLLFPVGAPALPGRAELRLTVYFQTSVVQSLLVTATIVPDARQRGSNQAVVDYNLTNRLTDLAGLEPRALSVMMNDSDDGTHRLVFNGAPNNPVTLVLTEGQMTDAVTMMRTVMRQIHIEQINKATRNRYDNKNAKSRQEFIADLKVLAVKGWLLWTSIWVDRIDEWTENEAKFVGESDIIQIARKQNSTSVFPWAMVYSIPIDTGAPEKNRLCRLLEEGEWKKFQATPASPLRCPFEAEHGEDVICPYGFWGFRYQIEQPPSLRPGRARVVNIPAAPVPLDFVAALSDELDAGLLKTHLEVLKAQHKNFHIQECRTRDKIRDGLGTRDLEVAYFYCHGLTNPLPGVAGTTPSLGVGKKEVIHPPDLVKWVLKTWPKDHWKAIAPLVFINGCHTADTSPQTLVNFVDTFSGPLKAAGVLGTEITVHQLVANEVAQTFLDAFQRGTTVGQALREARAGLLRKGNLLGLVYTAYCSAGLKLSASVV